MSIIKSGNVHSRCGPGQNFRLLFKTNNLQIALFGFETIKKAHWIPPMREMKFKGWRTAQVAGGPCAVPQIGVGTTRGPCSPHTELCAAQWLSVESQRGPSCKQDKTQRPVWDRAGGRANLFKALRRKQILLKDDSAVCLTWLHTGRGAILYPVAPPSGHRKEVQFVSKTLVRRSGVPCCLVPALVPSSSFEWLLCIHPDRRGPYMNTSS